MRAIVMQPLCCPWNHGALDDCREAIRQLVEDRLDNTGVTSACFGVGWGGYSYLGHIGIFGNVGDARSQLRIMYEDIVSIAEALSDCFAHGACADDAYSQVAPRAMRHQPRYGICREASRSPCNH